jgi:hypothetical protein
MRICQVSQIVHGAAERFRPLAQKSGSLTQMNTRYPS